MYVVIRERAFYGTGVYTYFVNDTGIAHESHGHSTATGTGVLRK